MSQPTKPTPKPVTYALIRPPAPRGRIAAALRAAGRRLGLVGPRLEPIDRACVLVLDGNPGRRVDAEGTLRGINVLAWGATAAQLRASARRAGARPLPPGDL